MSRGFVVGWTCFDQFQLGDLCGPMRSVPPRGSGWVRRIFDLRFAIANWLYRRPAIPNRQLRIGNQETHPLPRGGTDLIPKLTRGFPGAVGQFGNEVSTTTR